MKKIALSLTLILISARALNGMQAERIGNLPQELRRIVTQKAILSSQTVDEAIANLKKFSEVYGVQFDKLFGNLKDFTTLVHMLASRFNENTEAIARKFDTNVATNYLTLSQELMGAIHLIIYRPETANDINTPIKNGADVNFYNQRQSTPLMLASEKGIIKAVKYLIEAGADVNQAINNGATPLMLAAYNGSIEIVKLLINAGANVNQADIYEKTPLKLASQWGYPEIEQLLRNAGAKK